MQSHKVTHADLTHPTTTTRRPITRSPHHKDFSFPRRPQDKLKQVRLRNFYSSSWNTTADLSWLPITEEVEDVANYLSELKGTDLTEGTELELDDNGMELDGNGMALDDN